MHSILIFGNSGSGKSTLAHYLAKSLHLQHLDLDTLAWLPEMPPKRCPVSESQKKIDAFLERNSDWVIEGCYSDLLAFVVTHSTEIRFLNPGVEACVENCKKRPWEPHKYSSLEEQNKNLEMLISWVKDYPKREDEFSLQAHRQLFDGFKGRKTEYLSVGEYACVEERK